jgi:hypothetical protein
MMTEEEVWNTADPRDLWILDKLLLSKRLGYVCGPTGTSVPTPGYYIVRPCVNAFGLGLGTRRVYIESCTDHLPLGHFWCEVFHGRHLSVDYHRGLQVLCVEGFKDIDTFTQWKKWVRTNDYVDRPSIIMPFLQRYEWVNCEYIGDKLIEIHLRNNPDFIENRQEFIPVWSGEEIVPPDGYEYIDYPDIHGRIGAFVK